MRSASKHSSKNTPSTVSRSSGLHCSIFLISLRSRSFSSPCNRCSASSRLLVGIGTSPFHLPVRSVSKARPRIRPSYPRHPSKIATFQTSVWNPVEEAPSARSSVPDDVALSNGHLRREARKDASVGTSLKAVLPSVIL